jgi:hypothetical protein
MFTEVALANKNVKNCDQPGQLQTKAKGRADINV